MKEQTGAAKMNDRMRRIVRLIVDGLALSARAVAWREGYEWQPGALPERRQDTRNHY